MRIGMVQLSVGPDPEDNLPTTLDLIERSVSDGATWVFTPEVTNLLETNAQNQRRVLRTEDTDLTLRALCDVAAERRIWISVGSLALKPADTFDRFVNRSFLIGPDGHVAARYDKIHMFDVVLSETEKFQESKRYQPGTKAVLAEGPAALGMTVCYDLRFPHLYRSLARAGAHILSVPSAFAATTGVAHWHVLLRARAIETGCFVIAAAQTGEHGLRGGALRKSYGHSLVVGPWGDVLTDMGPEPGFATVDIDLSEVERARRRVPSLHANPEYFDP